MTLDGVGAKNSNNQKPTRVYPRVHVQIMKTTINANTVPTISIIANSLIYIHALGRAIVIVDEVYLWIQVYNFSIMILRADIFSHLLTLHVQTI